MWSYPFTLGIRMNESVASTTLSEADSQKHQDIVNAAKDQPAILVPLISSTSEVQENGKGFLQNSP